ncbi:spore germination protein KB [Paenibacillus phyllosphaerae]|uniref:Spore germination protein KB n=1 Tax=Paenibacillus phyllosphaerae TaxID=274593 RepID=A0A7W5AXT9_9BACL|nr:endospore germination permease [Paenibacillus phyllosphaerae]MBB3110745.1 spore germination protein KB [Paenibacillus phyllosphaerae]
MEQGRIGNLQFTVLAGLFTIGDTVLFVPALIASEALKDAWLSAILALLVGLGIIVFYTVLQRKFPAMTLVEILRQLLGSRVGGFVSLLYVFGFLLLIASTLLREVGDFMETQILPNTPIHVVYMLFLVIVVRAVRGGIETIGRTAEISAPWVMLMLMLLILFVLPESRIARVEPVLYGGIKPVVRGSIIFIAVPFLELAAMYMIFPYVESAERIRRNFLVGCAIGGVLLCLVTFLSLTTFGAVMTKDAIYPSYLLAKKIQLGEFLQRIEALMAIIWLFSIYFKLTTCFYGICLGTAQAMGLKEYKPLAFPMAMILIVFSDLIAPNIIAFFAINQVYVLATGTFAIALPLFLLLVARFRGSALGGKSGG